MSDVPPSDAELLTQFTVPSDAQRLAAVTALARRLEELPARSAIADALVGVLADERKKIRLLAAQLLAARAGADPLWRAKLKTSLAADDDRLRWGAAYALGRAGCLDHELFPAAIATLASEDGDVRWAAAKLVVRLIEADASLAQALIDAAAREAVDQSPRQRKMICYCLRDAKVATPASRSRLLDSLRDADAAVRAAAVSALGSLWPDRREVADAFVQRLAEERDAGVRKVLAATCGVMSCGVSELLQALQGIDNAGDAGLRKASEFARRRLQALPKS